jgi:hypothetical protein
LYEKSWLFAHFFFLADLNLSLRKDNILNPWS